MLAHSATSHPIGAMNNSGSSVPVSSAGFGPGAFALPQPGSNGLTVYSANIMTGQPPVGHGGPYAQLHSHPATFGPLVWNSGSNVPAPSQSSVGNTPSYRVYDPPDSTMR
ncbi:unnamed protein product [Protopolystoma xenopodis]|uniref:Uncharacterized protein n=1 Tax=Protopolystoma xenopodis TaxID=117903 RepID=A0A3S5ALE3_9PLAT|nr:unnamed protein product [Protopolystoma xenopodis]